jgi:hypothetical protein
MIYPGSGTVTLGMVTFGSDSYLPMVWPMRFDITDNSSLSFSQYGHLDGAIHHPILLLAKADTTASQRTRINTEDNRGPCRD